jgi:hypothetical protein
LKLSSIGRNIGIAVLVGTTGACRQIANIEPVHFQSPDAGSPLLLNKDAATDVVHAGDAKNANDANHANDASDSAAPTCTGTCAGLCFDGRCLVTLAELTSSVSGLAVDKTNIYWTDFAGNVQKLALGGESTGATPVTLASGQDGPGAIVVDATNVYWVNNAFDKPGTDGGTPGGSVVTVPIAGGTPTSLATTQAEPYGIAIDTVNVYWCDFYTGAVVASPKTRAGTVVTLVSNQFAPESLVLASGSLYWVEQGLDEEGAAAEPGYVVRLAPDGGAELTLASSASTFNMAVDDVNIYWTDYGTENSMLNLAKSNGSVLKKALTGGAVTTLAANQEGPFAILVNDGFVYWFNAAPITLAGAVLKVPASGGPVTTLASNQVIDAIALDDTSVYWNNSQTLMKTDK